MGSDAPCANSCLLYTSAWGTGTAAVVSPIGELAEGDKKVTVSNNQIGPVTQKLYDELTGIQWGRLPDTHGWTMKVC